ncbi:hypothetical protein A3C34_00095 [Candidatus Amesbacteria bacterium RIFCSPHIGHO2_02_FULL_48_21]|uniref:Prepilin-type N-terminal cleavage/methylation domain-containing protein n=4 Tax=Candidatus Amesiibacteriota TaxID=1752730 RepID=A0A1F4Z584_9BACT|nr:MAG: hypothetical protein UX78_C0001G0022 [Candidatus Amesbacteria bacterium GW2011_GWA2_47_11]KKU95081.1 MAG: hypothetical protein UY22_C0001G0025 [Candidatus Amesbacteria bacterium GW2011_GWC1_48_10]KKW00721.1 MAG: hypothetical protein UY33_C0006G0005 [Candidatus Amesbacteria bacterium GW2011_GWA1_48_9]OGC89847.1 MAG: hypothetical protein A2V48_04480 [Candidatus Amesbacteria bacterium RBG_19FT_COMBO_48_16]OGC95119.1 MAG: hypothetical protein A3C34_00095 [Candidatus Amesbacteria bacterium R
MTRAFTLIEMLIYMGLLAVFLLVLGQVFFAMLDAQLKSQTVSSVVQDGSFILNRLGYDIHRAVSVVAPATDGESSSALTLSFPDGNYTYSAATSVLQLTAPEGTAGLTGWDTLISAFSVTRLGNVGGKPSLRISFTLTSRSSSLSQKPEIRNFQTTYALR